MVGRGELGLCQRKQKWVGRESIYFTSSLATGVIQRFSFSVTRHWLGPRALFLGVISVTGIFFGDLIMEHIQLRTV